MLLAALFLAGCPSPQDQACSPTCDNGSTCEPLTKTCIAPRLERFDGPLPGRAVRLQMRGARAYLAMIHPTEDRLLVGEADTAEAPTFYTLRKFTRRAPQKIALAASETSLAVAWLDADLRYRVALRRLDAPADHWQIITATTGELGGEDYRGSQYFDLSISTQGLDQGATTEGSQRVRLVFHDARTRALRVLSAAFDPPQNFGSQPWSIQNIDDPSAQNDPMSCSAAQRERVGRGIGMDPDILQRGTLTYVAYQDADCGDLRLARRLDGKWQVSVVDTGDSERGSEHAMARGDTGRFASLGLDGRGKLAIAYQDVTRGQLRLALERAGSFDIEVIDPGLELDASSRLRKHQVGAFASLVFDADDIPHIAYFDATTSRLRLSYRSRRFGATGQWIRRKLPADAPTGFSAALGYSAEWGIALAAERLEPASDGLRSRLELLSEDAL